MKVAIVQTKPRKGDREANVADLIDAFKQLQDDPPDLIALPEAALTGYFLEGGVYELAESSAAFARRLGAAWKAAGARGHVDAVSGFFENDSGTYYNSALYARLEPSGKAEITHVHRKLFLPTYGVFDEERFHSRGKRLEAFPTRFGRAAIMICEDAWHGIVPTIAAVKGARIFLIPSASPGRGIAGAGELESITRWRALLQNYASEHGVFIIYAGLAGFEGGKGMTGSSQIINPRGDVVVAAGPLEACIVRAEIDLAEIEIARAGLPLLGDLNAVLPDLLAELESVPSVADVSRESRV
ncbi:MAG: beta-ureidopropionase [Candidatus Eremiobacteraeota bacterium]|nr:beta-ureidopropionase [Candidatus Eremiobacteraeota bacterium]